MHSDTKAKLLHVADKLIGEGLALVTSERVNGGGRWLNEQATGKWLAGCSNFIIQLGRPAEHWRGSLDFGASRLAHAHKAGLLLGAMQALREAIADDLLIRSEELLLCDTFDSLLEQAEHLLSAGYALPAGVLGRAVLEERLRNWCENANCTPATQRPTMSDYYQALYGAAHINKLQLKHIELLAAIGNDAAHVKESLNKADVEKLLRELRVHLSEWTV